MLLPVKMNSIQSNDDHDYLTTWNHLFSWQFLSPHVANTLKSRDQSLHIRNHAKIWLKKSEKIESRYSCSSPSLISGSCATKITFNVFLALFYNFFPFWMQVKRWTMLLACIWMMTILIIWFVSPLLNMMTFKKPSIIYGIKK